ncbi:iron-containing alcohol dehydrogenase [Baekduia soli]|uniref:Iron-containing alcohol dehydrogenase n=1 Tax=Baekduia soli TaxID=496014 RepID=A0A5B8UCX5_9ACTN|nr:iron-containing alcohol dehydrogenase [Baekduia soli]
MTGRFAYPRTAEVRYGPGALAGLADLVDGRAFVIASRTLLASGLDDQLRDILGDRLAGVHAGVAQHVPRTAVIEAAQAARAAGAETLVSVGGGTPIDCAKGVALCLAAGIEAAGQFDEHHIRFTYPDQLEVPALPATAPPHIAVPTTLSGSEHTNLFGITDLDRHEKHLYVGPAFAPTAVILDGELALRTPADLWAASGVRALDHAVEGTLSRRHVPFMDALGAESLRIMRAHLEESAQEDRLEARSECLLGAWLAIYALTNVGAGLSHAIGHQLAAQFDMMHGVTSAIMLPHVLRFNAGVVGDRIVRLAEPLGVDVGGLAPDAAAAAVIDGLAAFIGRLERFGVPHTLSSAGATRPELDDVADRVLGDMGAAVNPRPLTRADLLDLFQAAW